MFFAIEFFLTVAFYQFSKNDWIFMNHGSFCKENIFYNCTVFNFEIRPFSGWNHWKNFLIWKIKNKKKIKKNKHIWRFYSVFSKLKTVQL